MNAGLRYCVNIFFVQTCINGHAICKWIYHYKLIVPPFIHFYCGTEDTFTIRLWHHFYYFNNQLMK